MITRFGIIALVTLIAAACVYKWGHTAGFNASEAAKVPGLLHTIDQANRGALALRGTLDRLGKIGSAVQAGITAVNTAADEANKRLADAGVMASCPVYSERDVRVLNAEIDRVEAAAGLAGS